jgi:poly-gamma-glutamate synthesis protein (capsule biosynthesis protein)
MVIDAGADAFFGHSAHIFQGIELHQGRPIIFDAGDFVDDYAVNPQLRNDWGLLFRLEAKRGGVRRIELVPLVICRCQVNHARDSEREAIARRITMLSAEMGTTVRHEDDRFWVTCAGADAALSASDPDRSYQPAHAGPKAPPHSTPS